MTHTLTPMPALENKRILIVEDTLENMRLFRALLHLEGALVMEADNARAGILSAQEHRPDLILMDIHLPGMDGLEATRLLRADDKTAAIPILAITASVMAGDLAEIERAGCDGCISKPIEPSLFADEIAKHLPNTSP
jgi:CheY-like chemotaxis protein